MKECSSCGEEKPLSEFYKRGDRDAYRSRCKACLLDAQKAGYAEKMDRLMEWAGEECERCGYDECRSALEFHHVDPSAKEFSVKQKIPTYSLAKLKQEAEKCILLCANCHREVECQNEH